jgi:hypothetical protein
MYMVESQSGVDFTGFSDKPIIEVVEAETAMRISYLLDEIFAAKAQQSRRGERQASEATKKRLVAILTPFVNEFDGKWNSQSHEVAQRFRALRERDVVTGVPGDLLALHMSLTREGIHGKSARSMVDQPADLVIQILSSHALTYAEWMEKQKASKKSVPKYTQMRKPPIHARSPKP